MAKEKMKETGSSEAGKEIQAARPARALSPFEEMDRWFENFFPRGWLQPSRTE